MEAEHHDKDIDEKDSSSEDLPAGKKGEVSDEKADDGDYEFDTSKYPVREFVATLPGFKDAVAFNPLVSLIGVCVLWGLSIWCMGKYRIFDFLNLMVRSDPLIEIFLQPNPKNLAIFSSPGEAMSLFTSRGSSLALVLFSRFSCFLWHSSTDTSS